MKAKMIITAAAIIFSITATMANPTETTITFRSALGQTLIQPVMPEQAEPIPSAVAVEFEKISKENTYKVFDLTELIKPEVAEEIPVDLRQDFNKTKK